MMITVSKVRARAVRARARGKDFKTRPDRSKERGGVPRECDCLGA